LAALLVLRLGMPQITRSMSLVGTYRPARRGEGGRGGSGGRGCVSGLDAARERADTGFTHGNAC